MVKYGGFRIRVFVGMWVGVRYSALSTAYPYGKMVLTSDDSYETSDLAIEAAKIDILHFVSTLN